MTGVEAGVFAVDFDKTTNTGTFDFGYVDTSKFTGTIAYAPLDVSSDFDSFWVVHFSGIEVNGSFWEFSYPVICDTGTSGSAIPQSVADQYFSMVPGATWNSDWNEYQFPCSETLPDFTFGIGSDARVTMPGEGLLAFSIDGGTTCLSNFGVSPDSQTSAFMFGQNLIGNLFLVFDFDNAQLGFASKASSGSSAGTGVASAPVPPPSAGSVSYQLQ